MSDRTQLIDGVRVPRFLYGTAWKEDETQRLTRLALEQGFRGIDTANQRRHYHEAAVGLAIADSIAAGLLARTNCSCKPNSRSGKGKTIGSPMTHRLILQPRSSSPSPVRSSIWEST